MTKRQAIELRKDIQKAIENRTLIIEITAQQKRFLEKNDGFDLTIAFENTDEKDAFNLYIF